MTRPLGLAAVVVAVAAWAAVASASAISSATVAVAGAAGHGRNWSREIGSAFGVDDQVALLAFA